MRAAMIPMGSSSGAMTTRDTTSANMVARPPARTVAGSRRRCLEPTNARTMWGTTRPIKPMTPLTETTTPVSKVANRTIAP